jgi:hypothetical protein
MRAPPDVSVLRMSGSYVFVAPGAVCDPSAGNVLRHPSIMAQFIPALIRYCSFVRLM